MELASLADATLLKLTLPEEPGAGRWARQGVGQMEGTHPEAGVAHPDVAVAGRRWEEYQPVAGVGQLGEPMRRHPRRGVQHRRRAAVQWRRAAAAAAARRPFLCARGEFS